MAMDGMRQENALSNSAAWYCIQRIVGSNRRRYSKVNNLEKKLGDEIDGQIG